MTGDRIYEVLCWTWADSTPFQISVTAYSADWEALSTAVCPVGPFDDASAVLARARADADDLADGQIPGQLRLA